MIKRDGLLVTLESIEDEQELLNAVNEHMSEFTESQENFLDNELQRIYLMYAYPNVGE